MTHSSNATSCLVNINNAVRASHLAALASGSLPFRLSIISLLAAHAPPISAEILLACLRHVFFFGFLTNVSSLAPTHRKPSLSRAQSIFPSSLAVVTQVPCLAFVI